MRHLYQLQERGDISKEGLSPGDIEELRKALVLLGLRLNQWYTGQTLVATSPAIQGTVNDYGIAALDILGTIAASPKGVASTELRMCPITQDLVRDRWIEVRDQRLRLTKRTMIEKAELLSKTCQIDICSFCNILNEEGNLPHERCYDLATTTEPPEHRP
ncbi:hypothetical protein NEDG_01385 [Nematocida displodere]|uniref:Uncharacterized protein n=1 Tax=Nematocida displodere TaxID=1805483 RepID=A0A177EDS2_9MICR|nr:hypothetical protein NEDG_01385 [Nematocida displodere]